MVFCPKCGRKGIKGKFCEECAETELDLSIKDVSVKKCVDCDKMQLKYAWKAYDPIEGIRQAVLNKVKNPKNLDLEVIPHYEPLYNKPGFVQDVEVLIKVEDQEFVIPAKVEYTYCPICAKAGSEYFEGVFQIRDANKKVLDFVMNDIATHEDALVTKKTGRGGNLDLKMTSSKYMRALGKRLNSRFNGELTETTKLFSRNKQTSKDIYRLTVLFKLRNVGIGDVVEHRGRKVKIKTIGKRVSGIDIETGKKVFVDL